MASANTADGSVLTGYRCVGDVTFDLDGTVLTDVGWVLFEVDCTTPDRARGIIGTYNHYATLQVLRLDRTKRPFRIRGEFDDGTAELSTWTLYDVVVTAVDIDDVGGFIAFCAAASACG